MNIFEHNVKLLKMLEKQTIGLGNILEITKVKDSTDIYEITGNLNLSTLSCEKNLHIKIFSQSYAEDISVLHMLGIYPNINIDEIAMPNISLFLMRLATEVSHIKISIGEENVILFAVEELNSLMSIATIKTFILDIAYLAAIVSRGIMALSLGLSTPMEEFDKALVLWEKHYNDE